MNCPRCNRETSGLYTTPPICRDCLREVMDTGDCSSVVSALAVVVLVCAGLLL
jgi:ribosomal protein S14